MTDPQPSDFDSYFFRLMFRLKIYEASGIAFQDLVSQIFQWSFPGFQKIAPWGRQGDGGNDGCIPSCGHYFQIYGPLPTTSESSVTAAQKAEADFYKLTENWSDVCRYSFVLNDRFTGIPAPILQTLNKIKKTHDLEYTEAIGTGQLSDLFANLGDDQKRIIVGNIPGTVPDFVDSRALGELLTYLANKPSHPGNFFLGKEIPPDFNQKIFFNGLTRYPADCLKTSSYQVADVDAFLDVRGVDLKQKIAGEIHQLYLQSKIHIPDTDPDAPDLRFFWLAHNLVPEIRRCHVHTEKAYQSACYIILSKYFETCDAYEHPDRASAP